MSELTREWLIYWPREDRPASIHSHARLPNLVNLASAAARAKDHLVRFPAHSGDVTVALSASLADGGTTRLQMEEGAGAVLEHVIADSVGGLIAELR